MGSANTEFREEGGEVIDKNWWNLYFTNFNELKTQMTIEKKKIQII